MNFLFLKRIILALVFLVVLGAGVSLFFLIFSNKKEPDKVIVETNPKITVVGTSTEGRKIEAYTYLPETGSQNGKHLLFVGGIHGGYEWNSVLLAYQFIDYLTAHPEIIPKGLTVTVIPSANPDGVYKVTGKTGRFTIFEVSSNTDLAKLGRFNASQVDLNRNFGCNWQATSTWQNKIVSAGSSPFSEPEVKAIQNFVLKNKPTAVVFWHSQSNAVYASECNQGILPETLNIMNTYAKASGYPAVKSFNGYKITGDAEGWLASINIPAITVELKTHEDIEWERNLAGAKALFDYFR